MATAARIGRVNESGKIESIIVWYDGYPSHTLVILEEHYNDAEKAKALIDGGQLFELDTTPEKCRYQSSNTRISPDRCKPTIYRSKAAFLSADDGAEYAYLFTDGSWWMNEE